MEADFVGLAGCTGWVISDTDGSSEKFADAVGATLPKRRNANGAVRVRGLSQMTTHERRA